MQGAPGAAPGSVVQQAARLGRQLAHAPPRRDGQRPRGRRAPPTPRAPGAARHAGARALRPTGALAGAVICITSTQILNLQALSDLYHSTQLSTEIDPFNH